jgi:hypothetical protein
MKRRSAAARGCADSYADPGQGTQIRQIPPGIDKIGSNSAQIEGGERGAHLCWSVVEAHDEAQLLLAAARAEGGPILVHGVDALAVVAGRQGRGEGGAHLTKWWRGGHEEDGAAGQGYGVTIVDAFPSRHGDPTSPEKALRRQRGAT